MQSKLRRHPGFMNNFVQLFGERYICNFGKSTDLFKSQFANCIIQQE